MFGDAAVTSAKQALLNRNALLPYHYSQHVEASLTGSPVFRGVFFDFPTDACVGAVDEQFMFGPGLFVAPVLHQGATSVNTYLPTSSYFYDYYSGGLVKSSPSCSSPVTLPAALSAPAPLLIVGGKVIISQDPQTTTRATRQGDYHIHVALSSLHEASSTLYIDDGEGLNTLGGKEYSQVDFEFSNNTLVSKAQLTNYKGEVRY